MKAKYILAVICGLLLSECLSAQTEEFRFKLYLESLSSGKKDTLELGVAPDGYGWNDCRYDSLLCPVYTDPFFDTAEHIGAFMIPGLQDDGYHNMRVECPIYAKKRVGLLHSDLTVVFPASEQPVKVSWDKQLLQAPDIQLPILTNVEYGGRFDAFNRPVLIVIMSEQNACTIDYSQWGYEFDWWYTYVLDSADVNHPYIHFYILTGYYDPFHPDGPNPYEPVSVETMQKGSITVFPNPVQDYLEISGDIDLQEWRMYSVSGRLIRTGIGSEKEVDCRDWPSGIYILQWAGKNKETGFVKIIKK
ncbi:MAG: T9SS type A sorting domain-containing protein [Bacteroides sp.]|nr:T9SS type A sorting domain-containing protein [Bacteroides sp.]